MYLSLFVNRLPVVTLVSVARLLTTFFFFNFVGLVHIETLEVLLLGGFDTKQHFHTCGETSLKLFALSVVVVSMKNLERTEV